MTTEHSDTTAFRMRGNSMDRLETFVAAAFAFAVTMLIISVDDVPSNFDEFIHAVKLIPSFAASFAIIAWVWSVHANWCRRYGLEDGPTIVLSCMLVFLVLIYIFPLRLIMQGFFAVLSDGYLPSEMEYKTADQVRFMFGFYAVGFWALSINFFALFHYATKKRKQLNLNDNELYHTQTDKQAWALNSLIALTCLAFSIALPTSFIGWSGYFYFMIFPVLTVHGWWRNRHQPANE